MNINSNGKFRFIRMLQYQHSLCLALLVLFPVSTPAALYSTHLMCEAMSDPLGLTEHGPRLSWQDAAANANERGQYQSAYQIQVASSLQRLSKGQGDLWDTGKVATNRTSQIAYAGTALSTGQTCYWHVRVWDRRRHRSAWSAPAFWTMGLLITNQTVAAANLQHNSVLPAKGGGTVAPLITNAWVGDWAGRWIGRDDAPAITNQYDGKIYHAATYLRKDFNLSQLPARATLYVTALGVVEPHLNGARVGNDYLVPGWTDYHKRVYCRAYDVTTNLHVGANTIGAILGDGWFRGNISILGQNFYGTRTRLRAELHLQSAAGASQIIASDDSWTAGFGPIQQSDIQSGEQYDARLQMTGWDRHGFSSASWAPVTTGAKVSPVITAAPAEPVQAEQTFTPVSITQPKPGLYVINFGQNIAGWAQLTVSNQPAGSKIVMRFGEWLNPDGTVYRANLRSAAATDTYICKGGGVETWQPHFTYHGFQYLEVRGLAQAPATNTFTAVAVHSALPEAGSFQCSNDLINHFYTNMLWTMRNNFFNLPTDCPQRDERMGWCDGIENMRSGMFAFQMQNFYSKWYQDDVDGKLDATTFPQMAPSPHGFGFVSGWADSGVFIPYYLYEIYGNTRIAGRFYADMQSHLKHYADTAVNYIGQSGSYGDWLATDASTPTNLVSTAFYAGCASHLADLAQALGKTNDAAAYRTLFTNIFNAFQKAYVSADGTVGSGSQSGYVLALHFNLVTAAQRPLVAARLAAAIRARNGHVSTGMVTTHWLLPVLGSVGGSDLAYQMLEKTDYPSWGYWIHLGATTMWEHWNSVNADGSPNTNLVTMNSFDHSNLGACFEWLYSGILGIEPLQPGFQQILIRPQPGGGLTWARGYYDSIHGRILSRWRRVGDKFDLELTIPVNATAIVFVPSRDATGVTESGRSAARAKGVKFLRRQDNSAVYAIGSGTYRFQSTLLESVK